MSTKPTRWEVTHRRESRRKPKRKSLSIDPGLAEQLEAERRGYTKPKRKSPATPKVVKRRRVKPSQRKRWQPVLPVRPEKRPPKRGATLTLDRAWPQLAHYMELRRQAVGSQSFRTGSRCPKATGVVSGPAQGPDSSVEGDLSIYNLSPHLSAVNGKKPRLANNDLYKLRYQLEHKLVCHIPGKPRFWTSIVLRFSRAPNDTINQANYTRHWTRSLGGLDEIPTVWRVCTRTGEAYLLSSIFDTSIVDGQYTGIVPRYLAVHPGARLVHVVVRYSWLPFRIRPVG